MTRPTLLNFVTCAFRTPGSWAAGYHTGVDYRAAVGTPIFATKKGKAVHVGWGGYGPAYGNHVILESTHNLRKVRHLYAHLSKTVIAEGTTVKAGDTIGHAGVTGNVSGPHLHYEERVSPFGYWNHRAPLLPQWQPVAKRLERIFKKIGLRK